MNGFIGAFATDPLLVDVDEAEGQLAAHPALGEGPLSTPIGSCCPPPMFPQLAVNSTPPPFVGDGPKTLVVAEGWDGAGGGPDEEVAADANGPAGAIGDDPKSDVPVDFPSFMTTVFLNKSSRSLRAAYLSSAVVVSIAGLEALGIAEFFGVIIPELKKSFFCHFPFDVDKNYLPWRKWGCRSRRWKI